MKLSAEDFLRAIGHDGAYQRISAAELLTRKDFDYDRKGALAISDADSADAEKIIFRLLSILGEDYGAFYVIKNGKPEKCALRPDSLLNAELCAALPLPLSARGRYGFGDLMEIMRILRGENGCQWDRAQTHESIRANVVEEAYELVNAIDNRDAANVCEEAGDVVLQGVFHAVMGDEAGEFEAADVISGLCAKLVSRHTHIFGDTRAENAEQALAAWERAKAVEKKYGSLADKLESVPRGFPALLRAQKIQKYAAKEGLEFENEEQIYAKIEEEAAELRAAEKEEKEIEGGDLLFSVVNLLRREGVDAECALNRATEKFLRRAAEVERLGGIGRLGGLSAEDIDRLWRTAKKSDKNGCI